MTSENILSVIHKYGMLAAGDTVVVGVSGGADSMCLLHFFNEISSKLQLNIICAHVNHGIRGDEADRDENFVREYCKIHGIPFYCAHFHVPEAAALSGESEEQCGRRLRYEFFSSFGQNIKIATAHNLNDCAETVVFNLTRGTGLKGLVGIPPVRGNIIRPLIECSRTEIEKYLEDHHVPHITDSTNLSDEYSRNRIRHSVLPILQELNPLFLKSFLRCTASLSDDEKYINAAVCAAFDSMGNNGVFSVDDIINTDPSLLNRLLIKIAESLGAKEITATHIALLRELLYKSGAVMLPGSVTIVSDGKTLYRKEADVIEAEIYASYLPEKNVYAFPSCILKIETIDKRSIKNYNNIKLSFLNFVDGEKLQNAVFRSRLPGDRFRYPNAEHSKSLKNLFKEKNISKTDRNGIPMLANGEHILWINGVGVSEYAKVTENTTDIVQISISEK